MSRDNSPLENKFEKMIISHRLTFSQKGHTLYCVREYPWYRFRFDFAWPNIKVAVECQSVRFHNTQKQLERDRWKINTAQVNGWIVLQFSGGFLTRCPSIAMGLLERALKERSGS